ncbi:MAG: NAD-dependent epimerase/dehydratase family protein [Agathobacter sp.]
MIVIKVLVCGSYKGAFQKKLNQRLKKEKQEVYVLNNDSVKERKPSSVFQEYRFSYDSESVMNVMQSVSPDAVIFCGALDESYNEGEKISQSVEYISGLMNVITCSVAAKVKRFIYLSSEDVFSGSRADVYNEGTTPSPKTRWQKALLQGENLCQVSNKNEEMEISVVRMPQVYGAFQESIVPETCAKFLESFFEDMPIMINDNVCHNLMYLDDAVEAVYRVLNTESKELKGIYHISPKKATTEKELYDIFAEVSNKKPILINRDAVSGEQEKKPEQKFISNTQEKLKFHEKFSLEEGISALYKQREAMKRKQGKEKSEKKAKEKKNVFMPIIETVIAFVLVQLFAYFTRTAEFHEVIDVYLVFTLVIAVVLGSLPTTLAVILSIIGKYYVLFASGQGMDIFTEYQNYLWILQIFALSVLTGYVRDRYTRLTNEMKIENRYLKSELDAIKSINESNVEVKDVFENRLDNYKDSYAKVYEIVSQLDELESKAIIFKAASVVADFMKSKDVSVYSYEEQSDFCRLMASTSELAKDKGKSLRLGDFAKVKECLLNKQIYMNRNMEEGMPIYAMGTYNHDKLEVVTMIWTMDLVDINLHQSNLLSMLSKLLERSMSRALRYMDSIKTSTYVEGTSVMEGSAFYQMLDIYCTGEAQQLLEYSLLKVFTTVEENPELYTILRSIIRSTDYIGLDNKENLYVLLTNSGIEDSAGIIERFKNRGVEVQLVKKQNGKTVKDVFQDVEF